ncbi:hypothetical protein DFH06DRAFT_1123129 [Mycena polygramma]|nr:hypothetical protein DFH06DRAFT_1123129 [Mycena polygramma]
MLAVGLCDEYKPETLNSARCYRSQNLRVELALRLAERRAYHLTHRTAPFKARPSLKGLTDLAGEARRGRSGGRMGRRGAVVVAERRRKTIHGYRWRRDDQVLFGARCRLNPICTAKSAALPVFTPRLPYSQIYRDMCHEQKVLDRYRLQDASVGAVAVETGALLFWMQ